ncbi:hypothetical protein [Cellulosimicrobium funkei]
MSDLAQVSRSDVGRDFADAALASRIVAWDIETTGLEWRSSRIATCQVHLPNYGTEIVQITPGELPDRLLSILESERVIKLFHHAPFDLRFMAHHWRAQARSVACTKITAKIVEPGLPPKEYSLEPLLRRYLDVSILKDQQTSDWLRPDLSPDQLRYAADDVRHLPALFSKLMYKAQLLGVQDYVIRSFEYLPTRVETDLLGAGDVFAY